ncbi:hypothetical protein RCL1_003513 [Eukaryota sp. TZLM3-RCL]
MDCCICFESFNTSTNIPLLVCEQGHSICSSCTPSLKLCPLCRVKIFKSPKPNVSLLSFVESIKEGPQCPQILANALKIDFENGLIGQGGNASVYSAEWNGGSVAVKVVSVSANGISKLERELSLMSSLNHPLVIRVFGIVYLHQNRVGIVMERAMHSLPAPTVTSPESLKHAIDIVNAVKYLHSRSIVHYDLKPANILIANNHIKLTDFGTSRTVSSTTTIATTTAAFTPKYAAPECLDKKVSPQSDVYSIGVILYEILCGREAYSGYTMMEILGAKSRPCNFEFTKDVPSALKKIIIKACSVDKSKRPSLDDILTVLTKLGGQSTAPVASLYPDISVYVPPTAPFVAPVAPVIAPVAPVIAPVAPVIAPVAPVIAPVAPVIAPVAPVIAPVAPHINPLEKLFQKLTTSIAPQRSLRKTPDFPVKFPSFPAISTSTVTLIPGQSTSCGVLSTLGLEWEMIIETGNPGVAYPNYSSSSDPVTIVLKRLTPSVTDEFCIDLRFLVEYPGKTFMWELYSLIMSDQPSSRRVLMKLSELQSLSLVISTQIEFCDNPQPPQIRHSSFTLPFPALDNAKFELTLEDESLFGHRLYSNAICLDGRRFQALLVLGKTFLFSKDYSKEVGFFIRTCDGGKNLPLRTVDMHFSVFVNDHITNSKSLLYAKYTPHLFTEGAMTYGFPLLMKLSEVRDILNRKNTSLTYIVHVNSFDNPNIPVNLSSSTHRISMEIPICQYGRYFSPVFSQSGDRFSMLVTVTDEGKQVKIGAFFAYRGAASTTPRSLKFGCKNFSTNRNHEDCTRHSFSNDSSTWGFSSFLKNDWDSLVSSGFVKDGHMYLSGQIYVV